MVERFFDNFKIPKYDKGKSFIPDDFRKFSEDEGWGIETWLEADVITCLEAEDHPLCIIRDYAEIMGEENPWKFLSRFVVPNGQYKNISVILNMLKEIKPGSIKMAVVGASSQYGSGLWLEVLVDIMLVLGFTGRVDAYDVGKCYERKIFKRGDKEIVYTFYNSYYKGTGEEYDIVNDDIWEKGGPGKTKWKSRYWSQKDQNEGAIPFFHIKEGRSWSHGSSVIKWEGTGCPCMRCCFEKVYPQLVRDLLCLIEATPCRRTEVNSQAVLFKMSQTYGGLVVETQAEERHKFIVQERTGSVECVDRVQEKVAYQGVQPEGKVSKKEGENWYGFYDNVFTQLPGAVASKSVWVPKELVSKGFVHTGNIKKLREEEFKETVMYKNKYELKKRVKWERKEDIFGNLYYGGINLRNNEEKMWCTFEHMAVSIPHNCMPHAHDHIKGGDGTLRIDRGWWYYGPEGDYCPICHKVGLGEHIHVPYKGKEMKLIEKLDEGEEIKNINEKYWIPSKVKRGFENRGNLQGFLSEEDTYFPDFSMDSVGNAKYLDTG